MSRLRPMTWNQLVESYGRVEWLLSQAFQVPGLPPDAAQSLAAALQEMGSVLRRVGRRSGR
jgi:hypothetical protein